MALRLLKKIVKPLVDFPSWMGFKQLKQDTSILVKTAKASFNISQSQTTENFAQAKSRLNLSEVELQQACLRFKYLAIFYLVLGLSILSYAIYLLIGLHVQGSLMAFCVSLFTFSLAFRNHFWFFQTKTRKLGCSPKEWFKFLIGKNK